jgi:hypothetical protein
MPKLDTDTLQSSLSAVSAASPKSISLLNNDTDDDIPLMQLYDVAPSLERTRSNSTVSEISQVEEEDQKVCRICLETDEQDGSMIAPCKCSGSMKYVHSQCLRRWRCLSTNRLRPTYFRCDQCFTPYMYGLPKNRSLFYQVLNRLSAKWISIGLLAIGTILMIFATGALTLLTLDGHIGQLLEKNDFQWLVKSPNGVCIVFNDQHFCIDGWAYMFLLGTFVVGLCSFANVGILLNIKYETSFTNLSLLAFISILGLGRLCIILHSLYIRIKREFLLMAMSDIELVDYEAHK